MIKLVSISDSSKTGRNAQKFSKFIFFFFFRKLLMMIIHALVLHVSVTFTTPAVVNKVH